MKSVPFGGVGAEAGGLTWVAEGWPLETENGGANKLVGCAVRYFDRDIFFAYDNEIVKISAYDGIRLRTAFMMHSVTQ